MRLATLACLAAACGSTKGIPLPDAEVANLDAISITPGTSTMKRGLDAPKQFMATGMLSNAATKDLTHKVTWSSSDPTLATVDDGLVTPVAAGDVTITATLDDASGTAALTVANPVMALAQANSEIDFFDAFATGDTAPLRRIAGGNTTLSSPWGLQVVGDEVFVTDTGAGAVDVFPVTGDGNIAPTRRITGATSLVASPFGIAIHNNEIYVGIPASILVFPLDATGNVAPTRSITGMATTIGTPTGLVIYKDEIYVASNNSSAILVFPVDGAGNIAPTRTIVGNQTQILAPYAIAVANDEIVVGCGLPGMPTFRTTDSGNAAPLRLLSGAMSNLNIPIGIQVLGSELYQVNAAPPVELQVFSGAGSLTGNVAATRTLVGPTSGIAAPRQLVIY